MLREARAGLGHPRGQNPTHGTLPVTPGQPALAGSPPVSPPLASYASIWTFLVFSASPHPSLQEKESFGESQPRGSLCSWLVSESRSLVSNSLQPHGLYDFPGQNTGVGSLSLSPRDLPNPGIEPRSPALQAESLPAELSGKPSSLVGGRQIPLGPHLPSPFCHFPQCLPSFP